MTGEKRDFDIVVIGAGIAGASVAAELSTHLSVAILERENQPGYHTSGRSAALFTINNGNPLIGALSTASEPFYASPPPGFCEYPLLTPRGFLHIAREDQLAQLEAFAVQAGDPERLHRISAEEVRAKNPLLREGYAAAAMWDETAADIDVHALLQGYLRQFRAAGGQLMTGHEVHALQNREGRWQIETGKGPITANIVINAAGSWADELATLAGARPVGLRPLRRTAMIIDPPANMPPGRAPLNDWPMTRDIDEQFYLKPEAGALLVSPADETPMPPQDIQPDEMDIAICIDRIEKAFELAVRHVKRKWAGLRTFAPDRSPVIGFDAGVENFFWLAGQGGYGFQTAPAIARLAAALAQGQPVPVDISRLNITTAQLSPERFLQK